MGSPGLDELRWRLPLRAGDRLHGRVEVGEVRVSRSQPYIGFVNNTATLTNQKGELVFRMKRTAIFHARGCCAISLRRSLAARGATFAHCRRSCATVAGCPVL